MASLEEVKKFLKKSVDWLKDEDMGCTTLKLDDKLAICVGWLPGYGEEARDDVIQSKSEPDFAINAGLKVWTSDDMRTDYEFINMPYYDNGEVVETDVSIDPSDEEDDYEKVAQWLLDSYEGIKDLDMDDKGLILEKKPEEEPKEEVEEESLKEEKPIKESITDDYIDVYEQANAKLTALAKAMQDVVDFYEGDDFTREAMMDAGGYPEHWKSLDEEVLEVFKWRDAVEEAKDFQIDDMKSLDDVDESLTEGEHLKDRPLRADETPEEYGKDVTEKVKKLLDAGFDVLGEIKYRGSTPVIEVLNIIGGKNIIGKVNKDADKYFADRYNARLIDFALKSIKKDESLKESWDGDDIIDDLIERAQDKIDDGVDPEDAAMEAIDEGLIYTDDIITLLNHYGSIDDSTIVESYYDDLFGDILNGVEYPEDDDFSDWEDEEETEEGEE